MFFLKIFQGIFLSFVFIFVFGIFLWGMEWFSNSLEGLFQASVLSSAKTDLPAPEVPFKIEGAPVLVLDAGSGLSVFYDPENSKVLFAKNEELKVPIASLSKLIAAEVILENFDFSAVIEISKQAEEQDSRKLLKAGETFTARDLLYVMLVESDNSAAFAFAEAMGYDSFIKAMNLKANETGMNNTYFSDPTGLDITNYSTAKDLAAFALHLLKNNSPVLGITLIEKFDLNNSEGVFHHTAHNSNDLLRDENYKSRIIGAKTGETKDAGQCLILIIKSLKEEGYLVNVVLGAGDRFLEMKKLINWTDTAYQWKQSEKIFNPAKLEWEQVSNKIPWQARDSHAVAVFKNKLWLMAGLDGTGFVEKPGQVEYEKTPHFSDVWSSEDGINWIQALAESPWKNRRSMQVAEFKGKLWLMGGWGPEIGPQNDVWSSEDGINWTMKIEHADWPAREGHQVVIFQEKIWLIGGVDYASRQLFNDVWYSEDGVNWTEAVKNAEWPARWDDAIAIFNNKLWVAGGMGFENKIFSDVWYSEDGVSWFLAKDDAWPERQGHALINYKNRLWAVGRHAENDVWYSEDGISWNKTAEDPLWLGREDAGFAVFKDKIWVLGGMDKNWQWRNDIWFSKF